jgi:hypothetical protein
MNKIDVSGFLNLSWTGRISTLKHEESVLYNIFDYPNIYGKKVYVDGIDISRILMPSIVIIMIYAIKEYNVVSQCNKSSCHDATNL